MQCECRRILPYFSRKLSVNANTYAKNITICSARAAKRYISPTSAFSTRMLSGTGR